MVDEYLVTLHFSEKTEDVYEYLPCFLVRRDGRDVGRVFLSLAGSAEVIALHRLNDDTEKLNAAMLRYGLGRLRDLLSHFGGAEELFGESGAVKWKLTAEELDVTVLAPHSLAKTCSYQITEGRDLYCAAAGLGDETAVGSSGIHRLAATSRPMCASCGLPDDRVLCSSFSHPSVIGRRTMGPPPSRHLYQAFCNDGEAVIQTKAQECRAGGNTCWKLRIGVPESITGTTKSPLTLPEALDFLDAVWRQLGKGPLVVPGTFTHAVGLVGTGASQEEYETTLSDIADAINRIKVDPSLVPAGNAKDGSLVKLRAALTSMDGVDPARVTDSIFVLQNVMGLRASIQHSDAVTRRIAALSALGIPDVGLSKAETLELVRDCAAKAVLSLRDEVRKSVDASENE